MKYPIFLFAIAIASCTKSALSPQHYQNIHQKWIVQEGHDQASWSAAQFCVASDYLKVDTIDLYYSDEPDNPNKFGYQPGSIYFHISMCPMAEYLPMFRISMTDIIVNYWYGQSE
jgi:hypothetical protein